MNHAALIEGASSEPQAMPSPCQDCGACCSFASDWPRFSTEDDAELDRIPGALVAADLSGMRCDGNRCSALTGEVGVATACAIYEVRPHVCRACVPGDEGCAMARSRFGLAELTLQPTSRTAPEGTSRTPDQAITV